MPQPERGGLVDPLQRQGDVRLVRPGVARVAERLVGQRAEQLAGALGLEVPAFVHVVDQRPARGVQVAARGEGGAPQRAQPDRGQAGQPGHVVGPGTPRVHHGCHLDPLAAHRGPPPPARAGQGGHRRTGADLSAAAAQPRDEDLVQSGDIDVARVRLQHAGDRVLGPQHRAQPRHLVAVHEPDRRDQCPAPLGQRDQLGPLVRPADGQHGAGAQQARLAAGRTVEEGPAGQRESADLVAAVVLQVLRGRPAGGVEGEHRLGLGEQHPRGAGQVEGGGHPGDAPTDHEHVEAVHGGSDATAARSPPRTGACPCARPRTGRRPTRSPGVRRRCRRRR